MFILYFEILKQKFSSKRDIYREQIKNLYKNVLFKTSYVFALYKLNADIKTFIIIDQNVKVKNK